ncbi:aminotransferase class I/II-fold pyridoxal phosphate-dependent enzyme, partial [Patescibacteria group bacterium]|nr:aminotransferase class I/II-fold pyridoxal phosphate-dependent enzyme [Patescibacteria group bacterium]
RNEIASLPTVARNDNGGTPQPAEVIIQAYTTIALPLAIQKSGFTPIYVDIREDTFNIDPDKIEAKITPNTKAIIVQHTFGTPAQMDKILAICKRHNLFLIEDCAHSFGAEFGSKKVGVFGDAAFFSFGRDKIISSTNGGIVITNDDELAKKIRDFQNSLGLPPRKWIFQQLAHPLVFWCSLPIYYFFNLGKYFIFFSQKIGLISRAYSKREKAGIMDERFLYKLPNALAILILNQLEKLKRFNEHRQKIAEIYYNLFHYDNMNYHSEVKIPEIYPNSKPTFLYYTIQVKNRDELLKFAGEKHIILGDWFPAALGPKGIDPEKFGYKRGDCPIAEKVGLKSINFPTNIKTSAVDAKKVAELINSFINKKGGS